MHDQIPAHQPDVPVLPRKPHVPAVQRLDRDYRRVNRDHPPDRPAESVERIEFEQAAPGHQPSSSPSWSCAFPPNRSEPMRTIVAPSAIACSKSSLIPIDRWRSAVPPILCHFISSKISRVRAKTAWALSGGAP